MIVGQLTTCAMRRPEFEICAHNQGLGQVVKDFSLTTTVTPKLTMLALDSEEEEHQKNGELKFIGFSGGVWYA